MISQEEAKEAYAGLFLQAEKESSIFKHVAFNIYITADDLKAAHAKGKYLFPVNQWELLPGEDHLKEIEKKIDQSKKRVQYYTSKYQRVKQQLNK